MADNIDVTPGTGKTVAADDIGGVLHQRVKISIGADGAATDLAPGQATGANSIPVVLSSDDARIGATNETAPVTDTAASGINGRLQRIAQRLTAFFGTAGTPSTNVLSVQGIASGTPLTSGGLAAIATANFTRPSDTTQYATGDLVANSTTAGSVVPMTLTVGRGSSGAAATGMIRRVKLRKSGTSITAAQFRLHLYRVSPTVSNGDNAAWLSNQVAEYAGAFDVTCDRAFTDGAAGIGVPVTGGELNFTAQTYYGLIEARAAYTPANGEVFTVELEVVQN